MLLPLFIAAASGGTATLHVGIHRDAGTIYDIAADGADGMCTVSPSRVSCPATRPVTFRWGPESDVWTLVGEVVVDPGDRGRAFVLAPEELRVEERAQLLAIAATPEVVRALFLGGAEAPPSPSLGMIDDLVGLAAHERFEVRRSVIDALVPFWRHTASDPFDADAPQLLPDGLITQLSEDENWKIRRRMANRLRDVRSGAHGEEAVRAMLALTEDRPPVQRAAIGSLSLTARDEMAPAEVAWERAMRQVQESGPPGRAAANTLGHLAKTVEPSALVDPVEGVRRVMEHHTERAWSVWRAWRHSVPFTRAWVDLLLRETTGLSSGLLRHWAEEEPEQLSAALAAWEPSPPHSERFLQLRFYLREIEAAQVRQVLELPALPTIEAEPVESAGAESG